MADTKISALSAATTPLAGTEVLPIVQSGTTVKVANNDLRPKQIQSNATSGVLQVAGPGAAATRVMTTPDANFTAARTDAAQSFSGLQTFGSGVSVTSGKVTSVYGAGGDFVALFQNTTSATPYGVWIKDASGPAAGYPLLNISDAAGTSTYFRVDSSNGNTTLGTGNLIIGTSGKGIDFSATPGTGTSELLDDYEEGTWTPIDSSGAGLTFVTASGSYTKVGNLVSASGFVQYPVTASAAGATIGGLPFTSANTANRGVGSLSYKQVAAAATFLLNSNATTALVATETGAVTSNTALSNTVLYFGVTYSIP